MEYAALLSQICVAMRLAIVDALSCRSLLGAMFGVCLACSAVPAAEMSAAGGTKAAQARAPRLSSTPVRLSSATKALPGSGPKPASAPSAPAYDLAGDLASRQKEALEDFGARAQVEIVEDTFVVAGPGGPGALRPAIDVTRRALAAYFNDRFTTRPTRAISVYLFPDAKHYGAYCKQRWQESCGSPYGFYLGTERRIVMNVGPGIGTLTHELVHPLVEADFPHAPSWINEGIASLFEQFYFAGPGEIRGGKNWRHPRLIRALQSKSERVHASLPALFAMSDQVFRGEREDLNYASARYFCQWLDQKNLLWPFYRSWRDGYAKDETGQNAFLAVVGKTPAEADAEWAAWVRRL